MGAHCGRSRRDLFRRRSSPLPARAGVVIRRESFGVPRERRTVTKRDRTTLLRVRPDVDRAPPQP